MGECTIIDGVLIKLCDFDKCGADCREDVESWSMERCLNLHVIVSAAHN